MSSPVASPFNSSDVEFEPATSKKPNRRFGQASIEEIVNRASYDRLRSKKTVKQLQFGHGAPRTREEQFLWTERFNAFRTYTLRQSLDEPFTGEDLLRFFDAIIVKVRTIDAEKPGPNETLVTKALKILVEYGTFTYPKSSGFDFTATDGMRIRTWIDDAVRSGRLTRGVWRQRAWLTFMTMSRMSQAWLDYFNRNGTKSWDITIYKLMSIVLITSLGCRAGDVGRSRGYLGTEYLQYRHIELVLDGNAEFANLRAKITLKYMKGHKDVRNDDMTCYLRPLHDPRLTHMCPIALLIIHVLRHGLVHGSTIGQLLEDAASRPDKKIAWLCPDYPVLCSITGGTGHRRCDLGKPTGVEQVRHTVKSMGLISNILSRVYTHGVRLGAAKDIVHLTEKPGSGGVTNEVREALGHNMSTFNRGITSKYAGGITRELYNDRAESQYHSIWSPKFSDESAVSVVTAPVTDGEIKAWLERNEPFCPDISGRIAKQRARNAIRVQRRETFLRTAAPSEPGMTHSYLPHPPTDAKGMSMTSDTITQLQSESAFPLDPQLQADEDTFGDISVSQPEIDRLDYQLGFTDVTHQQVKKLAEQDSGALEELLHVSLDSDDGCHNSSTFISFYSRINITLNEKFARALKMSETSTTSWDQGPGLHCSAGNSRDAPTPWIFNCNKTPGCQYSSTIKGAVTCHENTCSVDRTKNLERLRARTLRFVCEWSGCEKSFAAVGKLNAHIKDQHTFMQKSCPFGCDPQKKYRSMNTLQTHISNRHSEFWPTRCLYPSCRTSKAFQIDGYRSHLTNEHALTHSKAREPYMPNKQTMSCWDVNTMCPVEACSSIRAFGRRQALHAHLKNQHKYTPEQASSVTLSGFVLESYQHWTKAKRAKRTAT